MDLDPSGPAFQKIGGNYTGTSALPNTVLNPNLKEQYTSEFQGVVEKQLGPGLSARLGFTYAQDMDQWTQIPNLIPYSAWNIPITVYDGGTGANLATAPVAGQNPNPIVLHDLQLSYKTAAFNQQIYANRPNADHFETIEATVVKRPGSGSGMCWKLHRNKGTQVDYKHLFRLCHKPQPAFLPCGYVMELAGEGLGYL